MNSEVPAIYGEGDHGIGIYPGPDGTLTVGTAEESGSVRTGTFGTN